MRAALQNAPAFLAVSRRFLDVLGGENLGDEWEQRDFAIDGLEPRWVALPETEEQLAAVLRIAGEEKLAVVACGRGLRRDFGRPAARVDLVISLQRMNRILDHAEADLTLTVEAGATLEELAPRLAERGQWLPFDPPQLARTTIGGLIAANVSGPARQRHGTVRESLLGLRAVLADGTIVKSGGRVVKNVAGYDVHRLLVGSFGTLAVVTAASFKLQPKPEVVRAFRFADRAVEPLHAAANRIAGSNLGALFVEALHLPDAEPSVTVGLAGFGEEVEHVAGRLGRFTTREVTEVSPASVAAALDAVDAEADETSVVLKAAVPPASLGVFVAHALDRARAIAGHVSAHAHAGVGVVRLRLEGVEREPLTAMLASLRAECAAKRGFVVLERAPVGWKRSMDVWGKPFGGIDLMRGVKRAFDPEARLAPGRYLEGV